ncbi:MAG: hypothetical protein V6Z82_05740 [Flavobacteriales bacterium]
MKRLWFTLALLIGSLTACRDAFDIDLSERPITPGKADFTTYVALGASLTAGYQDGALYRSGQQNSYPAIIAEQMTAAGRKGLFKQPIVDSEEGGIVVSLDQIAAKPDLLPPSVVRKIKEFAGTSLLPSFISEMLKKPEIAIKLLADLLSTYRLRIFDDLFLPKYVLTQSEDGRLLPQRLPGPGRIIIENIYKSQGPFNNMSVPSLKSYGFTEKGHIDITRPYFSRMASASDASILGDALKQNPSFFSLCSDNDVFLYAVDGGIAVDGVAVYRKGDADVASYDVHDITDPDVYERSINEILKQLTDAGAKGVVLNVPDVTRIPYFHVIKWNGLELTAAQAQAANASQALQSYNHKLDVLQAAGEIDDAQLRHVAFRAGHNPYLIEDADLKNIHFETEIPTGSGKDPIPIDLSQVRPAQASDLLTLKAAEALRGLASWNGGHLPALFVLANQFVLTKAERKNVEDATKRYNDAIRSLADQYGLALADIHALLSRAVKYGITAAGNTYTSEFISDNSIFSLDGIHCNSRGYAIMANEVIKAINATYGSNIALVNPNDYPGIAFP